MDFEEAYDEYRTELFRYASRYSGDPDFAEDVVQEAYVRLSKTTGVEKVRQWLYSVVTNLMKDESRIATRRSELTVVHGDVLEPTTPVAPDQVLEKTDLRKMVREALDNLTERDRTVLLMREEGFSHKEIAEAVGTTTGSVGTLIARALANLAKHLVHVRELIA